MKNKVLLAHIWDGIYTIVLITMGWIKIYAVHILREDSQTCSPNPIEKSHVNCSINICIAWVSIFSIENINTCLFLTFSFCFISVVVISIVVSPMVPDLEPWL